MARSHLRSLAAALSLSGMVALTGCAIDVDLSSSPPAVPLGGTVTFDISVTNRTTCPVGGVVALLFPFIPKDLLISQIPDPELRDALSNFLDGFCSGATTELPDGAGGCHLEEGEIICEIDPDFTMARPVAAAAVSANAGGDDVTCSSDGDKITCRFPRRIVELAMSQQEASESLGALQCVTADNIAACAAVLLDPSETKSSQVQLEANRAGALRNWIISFATVRGGVCKQGLLRRRPCDSDTPCNVGACGTGICQNGTRDGFGCDDSSECGGGTCVECAIPDSDNQILSGLACTATASEVNAAPAASDLGLVAIVVALMTVGGIALRNLRPSA